MGMAMEAKDIIVTCSFCRRSTDMETAVDDGWVPEFYIDANTAGPGPACSACAGRHLDMSEPDGLLHPLVRVASISLIVSKALE